PYLRGQNRVGISVFLLRSCFSLHALPSRPCRADRSEAEHAVLGLRQSVVARLLRHPPHGGGQLSQDVSRAGLLGQVDELVRILDEVVELVVVEAVEDVLEALPPDDALGVAESLTVELRVRLWPFERRTAAQPGAEVAPVAAEVLA